MNRRSYCAQCTGMVVAILLLCTIIARSQQFPAGFQTIQIAQHLNPTDMKFSPGGDYLFVTDKSGKLWMAQNDVWHDQPILDISSLVDPFDEKGLNHIAIDPGFNTNGYIYLFYTSVQQATNKIVRYTFGTSSNLVDPASALELIALNPMTGTIHTGGAMNFGPDGKLYVTTGDGNNPLNSQSTNSLLGKILRLNKDGSIPGDNPFYDTYSGLNRAIYAIGFRNPFTADIQAGTGRYFVCDVGQSTYEEINDVEAGKNYGWSLIEGPRPPQITPPADYREPHYYYHHNVGCAVVGGVFYNPAINGFPLEYFGKFFFGDYCNQTIRVLDPHSGQVQNVFATGIGRPVAFAIHPGGAFYYIDRGGIPNSGSAEDNTSSNSGVLWKVIYTGSLAPTVAVQPGPAIATVGGTAVFNVIANGLNLSYQWLRDGEVLEGAQNQSITVSDLQLSDSGALFSCIITNPHGSITSDAALLKVTSRPAPIPAISLPEQGLTYIAGTTVHFSGSANDALEGTLPAEKLTWKIDFHHDEHSHPVMASTSGITNGMFEISAVHEVSHNVWYRVYLTAENNIGLKKTIFRDIHPQKVTINLEAFPGIALNVDGSSTPTPANIISVKGVVRSLAAPQKYMMADTLFLFERWGNGSTNNELVFTTPLTDTTITAIYRKKAVWNGTGLTGKYYNLTGSANFNGNPALVREDSTINFTWSHASPAPDIIRVDEFSVRWTGFVQPRSSGMYTFYVTSDDGIRLFINGQLVIDRWVNQIATETSAQVTLSAGARYSIQLDYFDSFSEAVCQLRWSGPGVARQIIPQNALFAPVGAPLPVNFIRFYVRPETDALQLFWQIEDPVDVKEYVVEKSRGGNAFEAVAVIPTSANNRYSYSDYAVNKNIMYQYRIRQVDVDGSLSYSPIRAGLLSSDAKFDFLIWPNPLSTTGSAQVVFTLPVNKVMVQVSSADGRIWLRRQLQPAGGQSLELPLKGLAKGIYFVRVSYEDRVITKRLLVQ